MTFREVVSPYKHKGYQACGVEVNEKKLEELEKEIKEHEDKITEMELEDEEAVVPKSLLQSLNAEEGGV